MSSVGTISIEKSEYLARRLKKLGIPHNVLNAKKHAREAEIVAQAGRTAQSPFPPTWPAAELTSYWAAIRTSRRSKVQERRRDR